MHTAIESTQVVIIDYMQTLTDTATTNAEFPMTLSLDDFAAMTIAWQGQAAAEPDDVRVAMIAEALASVLQHRTRMQAKRVARQNNAVPLWCALRQALVARLARSRQRLADMAQTTVARASLG